MAQMPQHLAPPTPTPSTASEAHPLAQGYFLGPSAKPPPSAWRPERGCAGALGLPKAAGFHAFDHPGDAFSTLMFVLRRRVQPRRAAAAVAARRSHCSIAVLPPHLARQVEASSRSLAPGASAELLELGRSVSV